MTSDKQRAQEHLQKNIEFLALSPSERRMVIAADALALIEVGVIQPASGTYGPSAILRAKDPLEQASSLNGECYACALGSCFIAAFNRIKSETQVGPEGCFLSTRWPATELERLFGTLNEYFSEAQLSLIEASFEGAAQGALASSFGAKRYQLSDEQSEAAHEFTYEMSSPLERLRAILTNVIENCGEFKP